MTVTLKSQFRNSALKAAALLSMSLPLLTLAPQAAQADASQAQCTQALGIKVCATLQEFGYDLYAQSGTVTSQKTLLPPEGGCPMFTINAFRGRFRIEGCFVNSSPTPKLQGAVRRLGTAQQQAFILNLPKGYFLGDDRHLGDGQKVGYELFWDGVRVGFEPGWTKQQGIDNLLWNKQTYPNKTVSGMFNGEPIVFQEAVPRPQAIRTFR